MANKKSTATSRFTPKELPTDHPAKTADLMMECERLKLLARINGRKENFDTAEHIAELYTLIGLNLAQSQLRMAF